MKKLIIAVFAVCTAVAVQAAAANWKATVSNMYAGNATDKFTGTAYIFDAGVTSQAALFAIFDAGTAKIVNNTEQGGVQISGGNFSKLVPEQYCATGYIPAAQDPETGMYTVKTGSYVAQIGTTKYESLQAALDAVEDGQKIVILTDITETVYDSRTEKDRQDHKSLCLPGCKIEFLCLLFLL